VFRKIVWLTLFTIPESFYDNRERNDATVKNVIGRAVEYIRQSVDYRYLFRRNEVGPGRVIEMWGWKIKKADQRSAS